MIQNRGPRAEVVIRKRTRSATACAHHHANDAGLPRTATRENQVNTEQRYRRGRTGVQHGSTATDPHDGTLKHPASTTGSATPPRTTGTAGSSGRRGRGPGARRHGVRSACDSERPTAVTHGQSWSLNGGRHRSAQSAFALVRALETSPKPVVRGGVEPPTFRFSGGRSYQLSYLTVAGSSYRHGRRRAPSGPDGI